MTPSSVYIHIPFCKSICSYCDFCKVLYTKEWAVNYLKSLKTEIQNRYMGEEISTIYIGGGTPSALSLKEIEYLLNLTNLFHKDKLQEFTFECNVEDITEELLDLLKKHHVNRLSVGVQSFDSTNLRFMKRKSVFEDVKNKMALMRIKGFDNINLDLMYALPEEEYKIVKKDVKLFLKLNPEHISTYSLMLEDNTFLKYQKVNNIEEDLDAKMYDYICKKLSKSGYEHYEVSNFAKPGYKSKHNLVYWSNQEYYGFGSGASGYVGGVRYDNTRSLSQYLDGHVNSKETLLSKEDIMNYEVILNFRKLEGINLKEFYDKYQVNLQDAYPIKPLLQTGDLIHQNGYVKINPTKIYIMNEILLKIV